MALLTVRPGEALCEGDDPNDPRRHFVATPLFERLWTLEVKRNDYDNAVRVFIALPLPEVIDEDCQKLLDKHFPERIKLTLWQRIKAVFNY